MPWKYFPSQRVSKTSGVWTLTDCCVQIGQPLLKLLLQVEFFFGITFSKSRQQEPHGHGSASHAEEHSTGQLADVQSAVEADSVTVEGMEGWKPQIQATVTPNDVANVRHCFYSRHELIIVQQEEVKINLNCFTLKPIQVYIALKFQNCFI